MNTGSYNHNNKSLYLSAKDILTSNISESKKIRPITDDIFKVEKDYYVRFNSSILKQLPNRDKINGYKLLNQPEKSVLLFPLIIVMVLSGCLYTNLCINKHLRGEYISIHVKNGNITCDQSKKLEFKNNIIVRDKEEYTVNNVSMEIKDNKNNVVGKYERPGVLYIKDDSKSQTYILKSSAKYKNECNKKKR
ncbi:hypothetical protein ACMZ6Z_08605 [Streptococcus pluranimalium]|uniref:hypothetical protein n=1 Tax=Streptococcus pluranimalium TaxID=82348 RepID=UPI0039FDCFC3